MNRFVKLDSALNVPADVGHVVIGNYPAWNPQIAASNPGKSFLKYLTSIDSTTEWGKTLIDAGKDIKQHPFYSAELKRAERYAPHVYARGKTIFLQTGRNPEYGPTRTRFDAVAAAALIDAEWRGAYYQKLNGLWIDNWLHRIDGSYDLIKAEPRPHTENLEEAILRFRGMAFCKPRLVVNIVDPWNAWAGGRWKSIDTGNLNSLIAAAEFNASWLFSLGVEVYFELFDMKVGSEQWRAETAIAFSHAYAALGGTVWHQFGDPNSDNARRMREAAGPRVITNG